MSIKNTIILLIILRSGKVLFSQVFDNFLNNSWVVTCGMGYECDQ